MAVIAIEPEVKCLFFLKTNKSNESIQYKRTHLPRLCAETADKCNKSHLMYFTLCVLMHRWETTGMINCLLWKGLLPDLLECQMHVWTNI